MSNSLAIATVTETLVQRLVEFLAEANGGTVPGARVTHLEPGSPELDTDQPGVNVYLFQVTRNADLANDDLPTRSRTGGLIHRPQAALVLRYLLSFYGNQQTLEPQRLMGSVAAGLNAEPELPPALITQVVDATPYLAGSDLMDQVQRVRLTASSMTPQAMAEIWSYSFQARFRVSMLYDASVVLLDWPGQIEAALPVHAPALGVGSFAEPIITRLANAQGGAPFEPGALLVISGRNFTSGLGAVVLVNGTAAHPNSVAPTRIEVPLTTEGVPGLRAGLLEVRVAVLRPQPDRRQPLPGAQSTPHYAVLHPGLLGPPRYQDGQVVVRIAPAVPAGQPAALLLNRVGTGLGGSFRIDSPPGLVPREEVAFGAADVPPGIYLVRIAVSGVESLLHIDQDRQSPTFGRYDAPRVTIPEREEP